MKRIVRIAVLLVALMAVIWFVACDGAVPAETETTAPTPRKPLWQRPRL